MPQISFAKTAKILTVENGQILMQALLDQQVPVASSCHGEGVCGKCKVKVLQGAQNLSAPTGVESFLQEKYQLANNERISCQTHIHGDVQLDTGYW